MVDVHRTARCCDLMRVGVTRSRDMTFSEILPRPTGPAG